MLGSDARIFATSAVPRKPLAPVRSTRAPSNASTMPTVRTPRLEFVMIVPPLSTSW